MQSGVGVHFPRGEQVINFTRVPSEKTPLAHVTNAFEPRRRLTGDPDMNAFFSTVRFAIGSPQDIAIC